MNLKSPSRVRESNELGSIGNYVWLDEDGDGDQDAGESGIPNVLVTLTNGWKPTPLTRTPMADICSLTCLLTPGRSLSHRQLACIKLMMRMALAHPDVTVVDLSAG